MGKLGIGRIAALVLALLVTVGGGAAADDGVKVRVERIDTLQYPTVRIVASVVDAAGRPVRGLGASDLVLTEDGIPVPARVDLASDSSPVALAFVLDASGSMAGGPLQEAVSATAALTQRLGPKDQAALITFRDSAEVGQALTTDKAAVASAARRIVPDRAQLASWRAFDEALAAAGAALRGAAPGSRAAIVLVTDGFDASSTPTQRATAIAQARASLFPVYTVAVGAQLDRATFQAIAEASSGQSFFAPSAAQLSAAYASLSEQILTQYSIAYFSTILGQPGEGREVQLQIAKGGMPIARTTVAYSVPVNRGVIPATPQPTSAPSAAGATAQPAPAAPRERNDLPTSLNAGAAIASLPPGLVNDPAVTIAILGAGAAFALFLFIANGAFGGDSKLRLRLDSFVPAASAIGDAAEPLQPFRVRVLRRIFAAIGMRLAQITPNKLVRSSAASLDQAGHPLGLTPTDFLGVRAASTIVFSALFFLPAVFLVRTAEGIALLAFAGVIVGYVLPGVILGRLVSKRKKEIVRVLPSTVDMIALSVEAGLSFDGAIAQVAIRRHNALSDEFRRLLVEFQMGRPRKDALHELASRCGVGEIGRLMNTVMQADALGAPLSKALADLSIDLRTRRRQRAEELARTAPIKMLFPMVGLIFPALFVVIIGPAVPRVMSLFTTVAH